MRQTLPATAFWILLCLLPARPSHAVCTGDCDGGGAVEVSELVAAVNAALGLQSVSLCSAADANRDESVTVDELVAAVNAALTGCPADDPDLTVVTLNLLHGAFCASEGPGTDACRLSDRVELFFRWVQRHGCPDVVTLQEIWDLALPLIDARLAGTCPFTYHTVFHPLPPSPSALDQEMILTRYPVRSSELQFLFPGFRHFLHARIDHPRGPIDIVTTHLASGSDQGSAPCGIDCPPECVDEGVETVRECQAVQLAAFVEARRNPAMPAVVTGDFNAAPDSALYQRLTSLGWLDAYAAAGNPECDDGTGSGCTSGREDETLSDLEAPDTNLSARIDYVFVRRPDGTSACAPVIDTAGDDDRDGTGTLIFGDTPNPFAPACGPLPAPICWSSDHAGVVADLNCN